jgi:hypothetical protein
MNIVGIANVPAVVPCPPDEADSSPTNHLERFAVLNIPDVKISGLVRDGARIRGITFEYPEASTLQLQATRDFQTWTPVTFLYGDPGTTTWTSTPLNNYGDFYRLLLAAEGHTTFTNNLAPMAAGDSQTSQPAVSNSEGRVLSCRPRNSSIEVTVQTVLGFRYAINLITQFGQKQPLREIEGSDNPTTVLLDGRITNPVLVTIERLQE